MWTIPGKARGGFCDGLTRRDFLRVGGLALGGLALPELLRAEARAGVDRSHKAVIMVFLPGGPPHQDTFDLKPDAPAEIRGEFRPIPTAVPGISICEHLPRLAAIMDKVALVRSIADGRDEHAAHHCFSGYAPSVSTQQGGRPSLGSIVSKLQGPVDPSVPAFVGLSPRMGFAPWSSPGDPGYLGVAHSAFTPNGPDLANMTLHRQVDPPRMAGRKALLRQFDALHREADARGAIEGADAFTAKAFDILTSRAMVDALDVTREDPAVRARYGRGDMTNVGDGGPCCNDQFLIARRLVEAGARCVTLAFGRWDYHSNNFAQCRERLPKLDQALSALIEDIHERGLDRDVSVVAWGEFGRSPRINKDAGRDHWPGASCALLAGGGMRTGQVIGSTNRLGEVPKDRPLTFQNVFATLYRNLGIDPATTLPNQVGRPMHLLDEFEPIRELI